MSDLVSNIEEKWESLTIDDKRMTDEGKTCTSEHQAVNDEDVKLCEKNPLDLLPTEIWVSLFNKYLSENPRDLINLSETCSLFHHFLLPDIPACRLAEVFPLLVEWLGSEDVYTCRLVSRRVGATVDKFLVGMHRAQPLTLFPNLIPPHKSYSYYKNSVDYHYCCRLKQYGVFLQTNREFDQFHQFLEKVKLDQQKGVVRKRSPFPQNAVTWLIENWFFWNADAELRRQLEHDSVDKVFEEKLVKLLQLFPEHIFFLHIISKVPCPSCFYAYDQFRCFTGALPNLRKISLLSADFFVALKATLLVQEQADELATHIAEDRFLPPHPDLEYIDLVGYCLMSWPYYREIHERYGGQLKLFSLTLADEAFFWREQTRDQENVYNFPVLTTLHLKISSRSQPFLFRIVTPQLKCLNLSFYHPRTLPAPAQSATQLAKIILHFPFMMKLDLSYCAYWSFTEDHEAFLEQLEEDHKHLNLKWLTLFDSPTFIKTLLKTLCPNLIEFRTFKL